MQIGRRHSVWRALRAAGCLLLLFPAAGTPADARKPSSAQDLQYGEALFHYYQQDWFGSIVRLEVAQEQHALPHTADEAELLLGGLDLSYAARRPGSLNACSTHTATHRPATAPGITWRGSPGTAPTRRPRSRHWAN